MNQLDYHFFERAYNSGSTIIAPNDLTFKRIYTSQEWVQPESIVEVVDFFDKISRLCNLYKGSVVSLAAQRMTSDTYYSGDYDPPTVVPFVRIDSKGEPVKCLVVVGGHHRIYVAKKLKIPLEVVVDNSFGEVDVGQARSMEELNEKLCLKTGKKIGCGTNIVHLGRSFQQSVCDNLARLEM